MSWCWIDRRALELLHDESVAEHGGLPGLRDAGLLDSALARPLNLAAYGDPDFADLAAAYAVGLAKNHPFVDGNKRVGHAAMATFLLLNGRALRAEVDDAECAILGVASGTIARAEFVAWVQAHAEVAT